MRGELLPHVAARLQRVLKPADRVAVALSGGVDSVVLLDILHALRARLRFRLSAVHVNHRLSRHARAWAEFCRRLCRRRGIPVRVVAVTVARGDSVEAAARAARYGVFLRQPCDYVALAHNQDDQVETLLLQLLRGAGVRGLAGMPLLRTESRGSRPEETRSRRRGSASLDARGPAPGILRPLLEVPRSEIEAYARERSLEWVEDESNADIRFERNFLRHVVLPAIAKHYPAYRATLSRSARHLAESAALLDELAAADGAGAFDAGTLAVDTLRCLTPPRARNLLRHFLHAAGVAMPGAARLDEALRQACHAALDARVAVDLGAVELRRFEGRLHVVTRNTRVDRRSAWHWRGEAAVPIPELGGVLVMARSRGTGLSLARLRSHPVVIRVRQGGERLQPDRARPRRTLKNLMQEAHMPPWIRDRLPLLCCGDELVWAPAIGSDCAFQADAGEPSVSPSWHPVPGLAAVRAS